MNKICGRGNEVKVHWVPGHKDIEGNELGDCQANEAAEEMRGLDVQNLTCPGQEGGCYGIKKGNVK